LVKKLLKCQRKGLLPYGKYLDVQQSESTGKKIKKKYLAYIEKEIIRNNKKIDKINKKLS